MARTLIAQQFSHITIQVAFLGAALPPNACTLAGAVEDVSHAYVVAGRLLVTTTFRLTPDTSGRAKKLVDGLAEAFGGGGVILLAHVERSRSDDDLVPVSPEDWLTKPAHR